MYHLRLPHLALNGDGNDDIAIGFSGQNYIVYGRPSLRRLRQAFANDCVAHDKHHTQVDDLFAQWDFDPLELLSLPDLGM